MRTKKKFIMLLTTLILLASFLLGCFVIYHLSWREKTITLDTNYLELLTTEEAKDKKSLLLDYCSENTIGYLNNDGTKSLYIYSSPINFRDENNKLITIDTRIKNVSQKTKREQGYIYTVNKNDIIPF